MTKAHIDLSTYVVISIWFGCNNACTICMLGDMKRHLPAIGFEGFKQVLAQIREQGRFRNLILSGAEVTTFNELPRYVAHAASLKWFRKIQIQTNGRRLGEPRYLRHLVDLGVNEFFVSIHGTGAVHDAIAGQTGAYEETMAGIRDLAALPVNTITNTVLTTANAGDVPHLMETLADAQTSEMHLWNYFPMERSDTRGQVVSLAELCAMLPELVAIALRAQKPLVLKSFPECLDIAAPGVFDSFFPVTVLPDPFWREFAECGFGACPHRGPCTNAACWGLSAAYIEKYGDERARLQPRRD
ncbi:MAG: radical SAM protein [Pseudomonadota bacterium]